MPTTRLGQLAIILMIIFGVLWLGNSALEAWARMPVSTLSTKLFVTILYAYVALAVGVISGIMAVVAKFRYRDTSKVIWVPIGIALLLLGAVVRSLLLP